jgi:ferredoxin-NADP reductase
VYHYTPAAVELNAIVNLAQLGFENAQCHICLFKKEESTKTASKPNQQKKFKFEKQMNARDGSTLI